LVGIALLFSVCLGTLLWRTSTQVIAQSSQTVAQGERKGEKAASDRENPTNAVTDLRMIS